MITRLNLATPPPTTIQRLNLIRLFPPLVREEQYCGIVIRYEVEALACAIVHPYQMAHLSAAFPKLLPLVQSEYWPKRLLADIIWQDIAFTSPKGARPQLLVRTTRIESAAAEIRWQDRDHNYARTWESRVQPVIELLNRIRPDQLEPATPNSGLPRDRSAAPAHKEESPDGQ